jgi:D-arabinose 1-dehydrogenase-like Zn-dependent alcohol dehydrogenase
MVVVAETGGNPINVLCRQLIIGSKSIRGWYSGHAKDAEETLAFAAQVRVRPPIEEFPFDRAQDALERTRSGKARIRAVLLPGKTP